MIGVGKRIKLDFGKDFIRDSISNFENVLMRAPHHKRLVVLPLSEL
jgi:hypothetical protein